MIEKMKLKKLKDVCFIKPPKNESKSLINNNDLVSFVPMSDLGINQKYININDSKELEKVYSGYTYFKENDVLLAKITPCFENGKLGIAKNLKNGIGFGSSEYIVYRPKSKDEIDSEYLYYFLSQESFRKIGSGIMTGAVGHKRIPKDFYEDFLIPLPKNIEEQKEIVKILDKAFESIEQAKANIEKNIENTKELFQSRLNEIFSQKGDGWEEKELIEINKFIDYRGKTPKKTESGIRLITAKNVKMGVLNREPEEYIDTNDYESWMTRGIPQKGDVLFTTEAPLAMVALLDTDEKIALAQRIITLCPNREILSGEYLSYCMQSDIVQNRILEKGTGATVTGIKSKLLKEILIPIPKNKNIQKRIVDEIDSLKERTKQLEKHYNQKLKNLEELKKSILQKAFSGELLK